RSTGRNAINGACGGKNKIANAAANRGVQQSKSGNHIVLKIFPWIFDRFPHISMRGEMHNGVHPTHNALQPVHIRNVSNNQIPPLGKRPKSGRKIVIKNDALSTLAQSSRRVTTNVARTSNNQYGHVAIFL